MCLAGDLTEANDQVPASHFMVLSEALRNLQQGCHSCQDVLLQGRHGSMLLPSCLIWGIGCNSSTAFTGVPLSVLPCWCSVQCSAVQCSAVQCSAVQCCSALPHGPITVQALAACHALVSYWMLYHHLSSRKAVK